MSEMSSISFLFYESQVKLDVVLFCLNLAISNSKLAHLQIREPGPHLNGELFVY